MIKRIKLYFYKRKLNKCKTLIDKILFLKEQPSLYFYSELYRNTYLSFIDKDIIEFNNNIENIFRQGLETRYVAIKNISADRYYNTSLSFWYSDTTKILTNDNEYKRFIKNCEMFVKWYEGNVKEIGNVNIVNNIRRIKPYYYNIELIINTMIDIEKKI